MIRALLAILAVCLVWALGLAAVVRLARANEPPRARTRAREPELHGLEALAFGLVLVVLVMVIARCGFP